MVSVIIQIILSGWYSILAFTDGSGNICDYALHTVHGHEKFTLYHRLITGCGIHLSEPYGELGESFFGDWQGVHYRTTTGKTVEFADATRPVFYEVGSDSLVIAVQGKNAYHSESMIRA